MARNLFRLTPITLAGARVRLDTASGSTSPADITPLGSSTPIAGAILRSDPTTGSLPAVYGPDGVSMLYQKTLGPEGTPTGEVFTVYGSSTQPGAPAPADSPGVTVPPGWGRFWFQRLAAARAGTGTATLAFIGSSSTQGYYASNPRLTSMVARVRQALQGYAGAGGSGFEGMQWSDLFLSQAPPYSIWKAAGVPWPSTGSWSTPTLWLGPALGTIDGPSGATQGPIPFSGTSVDLVFFNKHNPTIESFNYSIDGGTVTGTVTSSASYGPDFSTQLQTVSGLAEGAHTVTITGGANGCRWIGVRGRSASGVIVDNYGIAGMQSRGWSNRDSQNSGTYMGGWRMPADCVVIQFPSNDLFKVTQSYGSTGTTSGSATITNSLFRQADIGRVVSGTGIPAGAKITAVSQGSNATLDQAATATGTITATITDPDPVGRWISNTQSYLDGVKDSVYAGNVKDGAVDLIFTIPIINPGSDNAKVKLQMAEAIRGMASYYGAAIVNTGLDSRQSWIAAQKAGLMGNGANPAISGSDDTHLSDAGHQAAANALLKVLIPS